MLFSDYFLNQADTLTLAKIERIREMIVQLCVWKQGDSQIQLEFVIELEHKCELFLSGSQRAHLGLSTLHCFAYMLFLEKPFPQEWNHVLYYQLWEFTQRELFALKTFLKYSDDESMIIKNIPHEQLGPVDISQYPMEFTSNTHILRFLCTLKTLLRGIKHD